MSTPNLPDDFYDRIKARLHRRVGRELRLAHHVLDLGCGACELVRYLAETYCQEITGVDISPQSFPGDRLTCHGAPFCCRCGDARDMEFAAKQSVDAVVMFWSLHEMGQPGAVFAEVRRVLRPGGKIVVVDFPKESLADRLWNEDYYHPGQVLRSLVCSGFEEVKVRLLERGQIIWASAHQPANMWRPSY